MSAVLLFIAGIAVGIVGTVIAGAVIITLPPPKREREPAHFSAIGSGRSMTTGPRSLTTQITETTPSVHRPPRIGCPAEAPSPAFAGDGLW